MVILEINKFLFIYFQQMKFGSIETFYFCQYSFTGLLICGFFEARFWNSVFFPNNFGFFWKSKNARQYLAFFSRKSLALEKHYL